MKRFDGRAFVDYDESTRVAALPCEWLADARNAFSTAFLVRMPRMDPGSMPCALERAR